MATSIKQKFSQPISTLRSTGFFHIFGAGTINKLLTALLSIVVVRILTKNDYGSYAYIYNIVSFFVLFNGLGCTSAIIQLCSETFDLRQKSDAYYFYGVKAGVIFDVGLGVLMLLVGILVPLGFNGANAYMIMYALYPLALLLFDFRQTRLRYELNNKEFALMTNVQTISLVVFSLLGASIFQVYGLIVGQYLAYVLSSLVIRARNPIERRDCKIDLEDKKIFWKIAITSTFNNGLGQALTLLGTFLVGALLTSESLVADYKVATTIPFSLLFIPGMLVVYIYPHFVQHKDDKEWTRRNYHRVLLWFGLAMMVLTILCEVLATPIVTLLFGEEYITAVPAFRILMVGFFLTAVFRQPAGNLLVTQRKLYFNLLVGIAQLIICVILSVALMEPYGTAGAAWAYTGVMLFGSFCNVLYYSNAISRIARE